MQINGIEQDFFFCLHISIILETISGNAYVFQIHWWAIIVSIRRQTIYSWCREEDKHPRVTRQTSTKRPVRSVNISCGWGYIISRHWRQIFKSFRTGRCACGVCEEWPQTSQSRKLSNVAQRKWWYGEIGNTGLGFSDFHCNWSHHITVCFKVS